MKFVDELENLMQGNYALRDEIDLKKHLIHQRNPGCTRQ